MKKNVPAKSHPAAFPCLTRREFVKKAASLGVALGAPALAALPVRCAAETRTKTAVAMVTGKRVQATEKAIGLLGETIGQKA